jgi:hypothetical protein
MHGAQARDDVSKQFDRVYEAADNLCAFETVEDMLCAAGGPDMFGLTQVGSCVCVLGHAKLYSCVCRSSARYSCVC